jgi:hypothetical protein
MSSMERTRGLPHILVPVCVWRDALQMLVEGAK